MGERRPALRHPWGPAGEERGTEGLPQVPAGTWRESPPRSAQSRDPFSPEQPRRPPLSFLFSALSFDSRLSPSRLGAFSSPSPSPTFPLASPPPAPSFLRHRTRRVSFIYLFITPAINTLLGFPSFSMRVGGEKGRKC